MPETYQPTFNLQDRFPELVSKSTVILHPRITNGDKGIDSSKMGGLFYWPRTDPWPRCPVDGNPLVPVLQVTRRDVPELMFPRDTSLFQFFWCPTQYHDQTQYAPYGYVQWRKMEPMEIEVCEQGNEQHDDNNNNHNGIPLLSIKDIPNLCESHDEFTVPKVCCLNPERVVEYPSSYELDRDCGVFNVNIDVHEMNKWIEEVSEKDVDEVDMDESENNYEDSWSVSPSTKVGGYVKWIHTVDYPLCDECKQTMEHLFSIGSLGGYGGGSASRWYPVDESFEDATNNDGININGGGMFYAFICRNCPDWPIRYCSQR